MSVPGPRNEFRGRAVQGGAITLTAQAATAVLQLAALVILSRQLPPDDFGVIAMIATITAFVGIFRDFGLTTAAIQKGHLSHAQMSLLFWINVAIGAALTLLVMAISPAIALFFRIPELQPVAMLLACTFVLSSFGAQHAALLQRNLRFLPKAIADISGGMANLLLSVSLAHVGFGYWALAWGGIAGVLVTSLLYCLLSGFRPAPPRGAAGIRPLLAFGANVTAFELINYFHRNLDNVLIGRAWGATALGLYSRAYQMMMLPIAALRTPIHAVALPVLAKLQDDPRRFRDYFLRIVLGLAILSMPLMAFLVVNARDVVVVVLGEAWIDVVPVFMLLGISGFVQPIAGLRGLLLLSLGESRRYLAWGAVNAVVVSAGFVVGVRWGGVGVAVAYAVCNYLLLYPSLRLLFRGTPVTPADFFANALLPCCASLFAAAANHFGLSVLPPMSSALRLVLAGAAFGICFVGCFLAFPAGRDILKSCWDLLRYRGA